MPTYNAIDYGAKGDGAANDAVAIQAAIDACARSGGGTVLLPAGRTYMAGSFEIKSNVEFRVERGARLLGATRQEDYPDHAFRDGPEAGKRVWIRAAGAENFSITGGGEIDGRCTAFAVEELPHTYRTLPWRPAMTCFVGCRRVRIHDITLRDAANWALHLTGCDDVAIHAISIYNNFKFPNCDGIDPDHCRNVRISDCHIEAADDCIVLKNTVQYADFGPTENVTVTGCTLRSRSCAIKIGSESWDRFGDIVFSSCVIKGSHRGLGIQLRDRGSVENVLFSDMVVETALCGGDWWGAAEPIYVTALPRTPETNVGAVRHVRFRNVLCRGENGVYVRGCPTSRPDVLFDAVRVEIDKTTEWPGGFQDPRPCDAGTVRDGEPIGAATPWGQRLSARQAGFFLATAGRIHLRHCEVDWGRRRPDGFGSAIYARDVANLAIADFRGDAAHPGRSPAQDIA